MIILGDVVCDTVEYWCIILLYKFQVVNWESVHMFKLKSNAACATVK